ncbi:VOC family protein [Sphingomonas sp. AOB5]|uniref:VOC family protein n=1 Tax=Sphingomonas sp. AOB5 TaxID=3034017 RepID=UPI0023F7A640|nr:VOC family protein [Sphingomonas sp. AOB5]MDF7774135.1 VOC family protein [Sphingomonas sp. AOB5]
MKLGEAVPVVFVNVAERERALTFYRDVLGFPLKSSDAYGDFLDMGSALIRMTALPDYTARPHPMLGWNVPDMGEAVKALVAKGVTFTIYEGLGQGADGVWTSPDGTKVAFFADPDGNVLSLAQTA